MVTDLFKFIPYFPNDIVAILFSTVTNTDYVPPGPINKQDRQYTGCHRRNGPNFGRVFLMLNYTDSTGCPTS